ncbi:MAG: hypothetical protein HYZ15_12185 [Sphingobacteriales bacterium]|nr:hypothetical protein [Sphingobacteriales bacterium]
MKMEGNLEIEHLAKFVQKFSETQCDFLCENCIVALESNSHSTGCKIEVTGDSSKSFTLIWKKKVNKTGYKEQKKFIEHGAETIAFMLTPQLTEFSVIEEATIGTGFDYWLGYDESHENYNPKNFMQARLEISGINSETSINTVEKRVKEKKKQTNKTAHLKLPAYVSVTEFASPKTYFGKK